MRDDVVGVCFDPEKPIVVSPAAVGYLTLREAEILARKLYEAVARVETVRLFAEGESDCE